jgi:predicted acetyltransferase
MALRLRPLRVEDEPEALAAHTEIEENRFQFLLDWSSERPWGEHVAEQRNRRRGIGLPENRVPVSFLVAEVDRALVGRISIRHELNAFLAEFGGHIGYAVRPAHRHRGYATEILRQGLVIARAEGIEDVLITCEEDNIGSICVIERLGGVLEDVRVDPEGSPKRRYWIR